MLAVFTGAALAGAVLAIPAAEAAVPESWKCRDHYETAMLLAFRKLSGDEQKGVMAFVREFGALAGEPIPLTNHPDADVIEACDHFRSLEAAFQATGGTDSAMIYPDGYDEALHAVVDTPAVTIAGMRAKARTFIEYQKSDPGGRRGHSERMILSLLDDVAGETVA